MRSVRSNRRRDICREQEKTEDLRECIEGVEPYGEREGGQVEDVWTFRVDWRRVSLEGTGEIENR